MKCEKMRINFILMPGKLSGGPLAIFEYANRLIDRGHEVTITTLPTALWPEEWDRNADPFPWIKFKGKFVYQKVSPRKWAKNISNQDGLIIFGGREELKRSMGLGIFTSQIAEISALIGCMPDCDINIATLWSTAYAAYFSKKGKPVYFMQHYEEIFYSVDDALLLSRLGARMSYQLPIYKIANSSWLQRMIYEKCGQMVPFSNNALDLNDFKPCEKLSKNDGIVRIMTFSRPEEWKGFGDTAEAMARVYYTYGDRIEWHVFGAPHEIGPNNGRIPYIFHKGLPFKELAKLYAQCDIAVCGSWYESFPLPPLEAMVSGTAVVTTMMGMEDYCIDGENCLAVGARDVDAIYKAVCRLIEDKNLRDHLAENGVKTAAQYDWDHAVDVREALLYDIHTGNVSYDVFGCLECGLKDVDGIPFEKAPKDMMQAYPEGSMVSYQGAIFFIKNGCKHHIVTPEIFEKVRVEGQAIHELDAYAFSRIPRGMPLRTLADI